MFTEWKCIKILDYYMLELLLSILLCVTPMYTHTYVLYTLFTYTYDPYTIINKKWDFDPPKVINLYFNMTLHLGSQTPAASHRPSSQLNSLTATHNYNLNFLAKLILGKIKTFPVPCRTLEKTHTLIAHFYRNC